jgi:hypothetical protein
MGVDGVEVWMQGAAHRTQDLRLGLLLHLGSENQEVNKIVGISELLNLKIWIRYQCCGSGSFYHQAKIL